MPLPKHFTQEGQEAPVGLTFFADSVFAGAAAAFCEYVARLCGIRLTAAGRDAAGIAFICDADMEAGAYRAVARAGRAELYAADVPGISNASSLLFQQLRHRDGVLCARLFTAEDRPDSGWRGLMIDLARGNYPFSDILKYADLCWYYRLNRLHLHFSDDGVYKLPSVSFPKLTSYGAYSLEEINTLRSYLADRGIMPVPEIEMPAHATRLTDVYPEFFGGAHGGLVCFGCKGLLDSLDALIGDVCGLFPEAEYIHVGCDEAPHSKWESCPACAGYMREHGIPSAAALYSHSVEQLTKLVLKRGRTPIVWEGFPPEGTDGIPRETIVMVFESTYFNADALTKAGFRVINTSWQPLYIVPSRPKYWSPEDIYRWSVTRWLRVDDDDASSPIDTEPAYRASILGAELCVWESIDYRRDGALVRAELPALAERIWNDAARLEPQTYLASAALLDGSVGESLFGR